MQIDQTQCHTDRIKTDAALRGVHFIDYNEKILELQVDLEQMRAMHKKHGLKEPKSIHELISKLETMETQVRDWVEQAGFKNTSRNYAVTILIEEVK
jgi:hypothetical protein